MAETAEQRMREACARVAEAYKHIVRPAPTNADEFMEWVRSTHSSFAQGPCGSINLSEQVVRALYASRDAALARAEQAERDLAEARANAIPEDARERIAEAVFNSTTMSTIPWSGQPESVKESRRKWADAVLSALRGPSISPLRGPVTP